MSRQHSVCLLPPAEELQKGASRPSRPCSFCHCVEATWSLMSGSEDACDGCLPRGCSCAQSPKDGDAENLDPANWVQDVDSQGRALPCVEWMEVMEEAAA